MEMILHHKREIINWHRGKQCPAYLDKNIFIKFDDLDIGKVKWTKPQRVVGFEYE